MPDPVQDKVSPPEVPLFYYGDNLRNNRSPVNSTSDSLIFPSLTSWGELTDLNLPSVLTLTSTDTQSITEYPKRDLQNERISLLIDGLGDNSTDQETAYSLQILGRTVEPHLIRALDHKNPLVQEQAAILLGRFGTTISHQPLVSAMLDDNKIWYIRKAAAQSLGTLKAESAIDALNSILIADMWGDIAATALVKIGTKESLALLFDVVKNKTAAPSVRLKALKALLENDINVPVASDVAIGFLRKINPYDRLDALSVLKHDKLQKRTAIPILISLLSDQMPEVASEAALLLGQWKIKEAIQPLARFIDNNNSSFFLVRSCIDALAQIQSPEALTHLRRFLSNRHLRTIAISVLAKYNILEGVNLAVRHLQDVSDSHKLVLIDSLAQTNDPKAVRGLTEVMITSQETSIRTAAHSALRAIHKRSDQETSFHDFLLRTLKKTGTPVHARLASLLQRPQMLNIEHIERLDPDSLHKILHSRENPNFERQPLAIVLCGKSDDDRGTLSKSSSNIASLHQQGFRVMYYEVGSKNDIISALKQHTVSDRQADLILIIGHGSPQSILLNDKNENPLQVDATQKDGELNTTDRVLFKNAGISESLVANGQIVIFSCGVGGDWRYMQPFVDSANNINLGEFFREVFPQAEPEGIFLPSIPIAEMDIHFLRTNEKPKIKFVQFRGDHGYFPAKRL